MKKSLTITLSLFFVGFLLSCNVGASQPSQSTMVVSDTSVVVTDSVRYNTYLITFNYKNKLGYYVTQTVTTWVGNDPTGHISPSELKRIKSIDTLETNIPKPTF